MNWRKLLRLCKHEWSEEVKNYGVLDELALQIHNEIEKQMGTYYKMTNSYRKICKKCGAERGRKEV